MVSTHKLEFEKELELAAMSHIEASGYRAHRVLVRLTIRSLREFLKYPEPAGPQ